MRKIFPVAIMILIFLLSNSSLILAYEKEIRGISSNLSENIAKVGKKMIAVVDFTDLQGNVTELGRFLAEEFSVAFAGAGKGFEVVDRTHLKSILAEHKLSATGIMDPQTARKLGQIAGVDALVTGTITPFGDSIRLSVKILDTATARVIGASSGDIAKTKAIEELLARGIETGTPPGQRDSVVPGPSYTPTSSHGKRIGPLLIRIERIIISKGRVAAYLEFANQSSDVMFKLGKDFETGYPTLSDAKGNTFFLVDNLSGLPVTPMNLNLPNNWKNFGFALPPKSLNEMVLVFHSDKDIRELGEYFSVSLKYKLFNTKDESIDTYNVSFTDIKTQKPK